MNEKTLIEILAEKGEHLNSKNKWYGVLALSALAVLIIVAIYIRNSHLNKKKNALLTEKNETIRDMRIEKEKMEREKVAENLREIQKAIDEKEVEAREIDKKLKEIEDAERKETEILSSIDNWATFKSRFKSS